MRDLPSAVIFSAFMLSIALQCAASEVKSGLESVASSNQRTATANDDIAQAIRFK